MSETSIVFGRILIEGEDSLKQTKDNFKIIEQLPGQEEEGFNYLSREMFNSNLLAGKGNVTIAFGRSYKNIEHSWDDWMDSFESLLLKINWKSVNVILETEMFGNHQYMWFRKHHGTGKPLLSREFIEKHNLLEFEQWYSGKGCRNFWGHKKDWGHPETF